MSKDPVWLAKVAHIEVLIETYGMCNAVGAFLQDIENMEEEMLREIPGFGDSAHHKNIMHQKQIIELTMNACDLWMIGMETLRQEK